MGMDVALLSLRSGFGKAWRTWRLARVVPAVARYIVLIVMYKQPQHKAIDTLHFLCSHSLPFQNLWVQERRFDLRGVELLTCCVPCQRLDMRVFKRQS